jgi:hypothetical protein
VLVLDPPRVGPGRPVGGVLREEQGVPVDERGVPGADPVDRSSEGVEGDSADSTGGPLNGRQPLDVPQQSADPAAVQRPGEEVRLGVLRLPMGRPARLDVHRL